jgi:hypothetical protein
LLTHNTSQETLQDLSLQLIYSIFFNLNLVIQYLFHLLWSYNIALYESVLEVRIWREIAFNFSFYNYNLLVL